MISSYVLASEARCSGVRGTIVDTNDSFLSEPPESIINLANFLSLESSMR